VESKSFQVFVFFDFVLFGEVLSNVERSESATACLKFSLVVDTEKPVLVSIAVVVMPWEVKS
jgi:hypothetical protein